MPRCFGVVVLFVGVALVAVGDGLPLFGWGEGSDEELGNTDSETALLSTDEYQMGTGLEGLTSDQHGFGGTRGLDSWEAKEETFPNKSRAVVSNSISGSHLLESDEDIDGDEGEDEEEAVDENTSLDEEEDEAEDEDEDSGENSPLYYGEGEEAEEFVSFSGGFKQGGFEPRLYGDLTGRHRTESYDGAHGSSGFTSESNGIENVKYGVQPDQEADSGLVQHESSSNGTSGTYDEDETIHEDDLRVDGIMSSDIAVDPGTTRDSEMDHKHFTGDLDRNRFSADVPIVLSVSATQANGYVAVAGLKFMNTISLVCRHAVRDEATFALVSSARFISPELVICEVPADLAVGFPPTVEFDLEVSNDGFQFSDRISYSREAVMELQDAPGFLRTRKIRVGPLMSGSMDSARIVGITRYRAHILFMMITSIAGMVVLRSLGFFRPRSQSNRYKGKLAGATLR